MLKTSLTQSAENFSLLINIAEEAEVGDDASDCEDRKVERSLRLKNSNRAGYLTPEARLAFTLLRKAFIKALIFWYFDLECHIRTETNPSYYSIGRILSQLTLDNLVWWHLVDYFSQKMILAKTCNKTHNGELFAIVKAFNT